MADAPDQAAKLFARASAAIAEAKRLAEERVAWRKSIDERIRRFRLRATFSPKSLKIHAADGLVSADGHAASESNEGFPVTSPPPDFSGAKE